MGKDGDGPCEQVAYERYPNAATTSCCAGSKFDQAGSPLTRSSLLAFAQSAIEFQKAVGTILPKVSFDSNGGISLETFSHRNGISGSDDVDESA